MVLLGGMKTKLLLENNRYRRFYKIELKSRVPDFFMYKQILITPKPLSTEFAQSWLKWSPSDKKICILQYVCHYKPFFILSWIVKHFNMMLQMNNWNSFWHLLMMIEISLQWRFTGKRYELAMCCTVAPLPMKIKFLTLLTCPRNRLKKELSTSWLIISTLKLQCTRDDLRKMDSDSQGFIS